MAPVARKLLTAVALSVTVSASQEGEDLMVELCDAVLANKQVVLPIPFEFAKERDVGYVGQNPILDNSTTVVKQESLGTVREVRDAMVPNILIATVYIKDSDQPPSPPSNFRMGASVGGFDYTHLNGVVSPTSDLTVWGWQRIKWFGLQTWLDGWVKRNPEKLVIVHSAGDVLYGGCDENTMLYKYEQIVNASGFTHKIVLGGEVSPYPSDLGWKYAMSSPEAKRQSVLAAFGVAPNWAATYANCTGDLNSICDSPPKYQYASSGFIMGPAADVYDMLSPLATYTSLENRMVSEYFFANPNLVTIDYAGVLSISLHNMVKGGGLPVVVDTGAGGKKLRNSATGTAVCFVHGNGNSFDALKTLAADLKA